MKKLLLNIGKKSKKAFIQKLSSKKKDKVLNDYNYLINKNRKLIINENKKDIKNAIRKKVRKNLIQRLLLDDKKISIITSAIKKIIRFFEFIFS